MHKKLHDIKLMDACVLVALAIIIGYFGKKKYENVQFSKKIELENIQLANEFTPIIDESFEELSENEKKCLTLLVIQKNSWNTWL